MYKIQHIFLSPCLGIQFIGRALYVYLLETTFNSARTCRPCRITHGYQCIVLDFTLEEVRIPPMDSPYPNVNPELL